MYQKQINMKKNALMVTAIAILSASSGVLAIQTTSTATSMETPVKGFKKKKDGIWVAMEKNKKFWYKLDAEAKLWWSADGKDWSMVTSGMWADKDGKWLKIGDNKLWWSADSGTTWSEVPEWKWQGPDGEWYKFSADWKLWLNN